MGGTLKQPALIALVALALLVPVSTALSSAGTQPARLDAGPTPTTCDHATIAASVHDVRLLPAEPREHDRTDPCPGIRPGGALVLRVGPVEFMYCSLAFIVENETATFVATAGHCVDPSLGVPGPGEEVTIHGVPGTAGVVAYQWCEGGDSLGNGCGPGTDFALIQIHDDKLEYVDPAMCHWGTPTGGIFTEHDAQLRSVQHFGWGILLGEASGVIVTVGNPATQARQGVGLDFQEEDVALIETAAISGDSGSGVLVNELLQLPIPADQPEALGVLTHISVGGIAIVQRLDLSLELAEDELATELTLVTA